MDLTPIVAFELNLRADWRRERCAVIRLGENYLRRISVVTVLNRKPTCTESGYIADETANSFCGMLPRPRATRHAVSRCNHRGADDLEARKASPFNATDSGAPRYRARRNATRSCFSCDVSLSPRTRLKNSTVSSRVSKRSSCR
jgi:hypothetical protein